MKSRILSDQSGASAAEYALIIAIGGIGLGAAALVLGNNVAFSVGRSSDNIHAVNNAPPATESMQWAGSTNSSGGSGASSTGDGGSSGPGNGPPDSAPGQNPGPGNGNSQGNPDPGTPPSTPPGNGGKNGNAGGNGKGKGG